jgi:hypothetical protein
MQMIRAGDQLEPDYRPLGTRIGWADERGIFLLPDAALAVANALGKSQGVAVPWGAKTLGKRLFESGRLLTAEAGRNTQKIRVAGSFQRVWHFATITIVEVSLAPASAEDGNIRAFGTRKESA